MSLMFQPLKKYAEFSGRARRLEFWLFTLFIFLVEIVYVVLLRATGNLYAPPAEPFNGFGIVLVCVFTVFMLAIIVPSIAVAFRRLHDTGRSAWWLLIGLLPGIGGLILLVFYLLPGMVGPNRFGPDPKGASGDASALS